MHGKSVKCRVIKPRSRRWLDKTQNKFLDDVIKTMRNRRQTSFLANFIDSIARESDCGSTILVCSKDGKKKVLTVPSVGLRLRDGPIPLCHCHALGSHPKLPKTDSALKWWCVGFHRQLNAMDQMRLFTIGPLMPGGSFKKHIAVELWHAVHDPLPDELLKQFVFKPASARVFCYFLEIFISLFITFYLKFYFSDLLLTLRKS